MRTGIFTFKSLKVAAPIAAIVLLLVSLTPAPTTGSNTQDLTFRLLNIERRQDQLQSRLDIIERALQNQAMSSANSSSSSVVSTQALFELQQRQLLMAEQLVTMQKQMLELQKAIDRQNSRKAETEKKDQPKEEPKPKVQPKKP
ncbi:MAG: hypothetical protein AB7U82_11635 [Blastocatellales bacterium]